MAKNIDKNNERTTVFGTIAEEMDKGRTRVAYTSATTGETVEHVVMDTMIAQTLTLDDGTTAWLLQDAEVSGTTLKVRDIYNCAIDGAEQQDIADTWAEYGEVTESPKEVETFASEVDEEVQTFASEIEDFDDSVPVTHTTKTGETLTGVDAVAANEAEAQQEADGKWTPQPPYVSSTKTNVFASSTPDVFASSTPDVGLLGSIDFDDSVPVVQTTDVDVIELVADALENGKKPAKATAADNAAKARADLYAAASKVQEKMNTDMASALVQGKRHKDFGAWNFKAGVLSVDVRIQDEVGNITHQPMHDSEGNDRVRILVNPTLAGVDGNPSYGAVLNRAIGPNFQHIDHPDVFIPCIEAVDDIDGVEWDAYSFNSGARAGLTIDLSAMAATARKDAAEDLTDFLHLDANATASFLKEENGGHRCGVTIINSHDGKSALSGYLTVMRTYCKNLAMRGANQQMFKVRHMAGSIAGFDIAELAAGLRTAFLESQQHLLSMAILRHLPIEMNSFDKLLTAFDRQGLITQPTSTIDISNVNLMKDKDGKDVELSKEQMAKISKITRGHAFNAVNKGWMNPDLDYVKCETDSVGTMFHAAQCMTGYLTHKPIFADGKRVLTGNSEGIETFMKKSAKATDFFENVASSAVDTYLKHTGKATLGLEDMADFAQHFADNPASLKVGFKNSKGAKNTTMTSMDEIPEYHTTWKHKVITATV